MQGPKNIVFQNSSHKGDLDLVEVNLPKMALADLHEHLNHSENQCIAPRVNMYNTFLIGKAVAQTNGKLHHYFLFGCSKIVTVMDLGALSSR